MGMIVLSSSWTKIKESFLIFNRIKQPWLPSSSSPLRFSWPTLPFSSPTPVSFARLRPSRPLPSRNLVHISLLLAGWCPKSFTNYHEGGSALRALAVVAVDLRSFLIGAALEVLEQLEGIFGSEILVDPFSVDLQHGRIGAGSQALHFLDGEESIGSGLSALDAEVFLAGLDDLLGAAELAGRGAADLQVELSHSFAVEHGVEGGHLVDVHLVDLGDARHLPHRCQREEVIVLLLGEVQQRDDRRSPPVGGEFRQDYLHLLVVFGAEIERRGVVVVGSLSVREISAGEGEDCPLQQRPAQLLHHNYYTPQHSPSLLSPSERQQKRWSWLWAEGGSRWECLFIIFKMSNVNRIFSGGKGTDSQGRSANLAGSMFKRAPIFNHVATDKST